MVGEAADGEKAIEAVAALRPAVVLLDIQLPGADGLAVAEGIAAGPDPPGGRARLEPRPGGLRAAARADVGARFHREERALGRGARSARRLRRMRLVGLLVWPAALGAGRGGGGGGVPLGRAGAVAAGSRGRPDLHRLRASRLAAQPRARRAARGHGRRLVPRQLLRRPAVPAPRAARPPDRRVRRLAAALAARSRDGRDRVRRGGRHPGVAERGRDRRARGRPRRRGGARLRRRRRERRGASGRRALQAAGGGRSSRSSPAPPC